MNSLKKKVESYSSSSDAEPQHRFQSLRACLHDPALPDISPRTDISYGNEVLGGPGNEVEINWFIA